MLLLQLHYVPLPIIRWWYTRTTLGFGEPRNWGHWHWVEQKSVDARGEAHELPSERLSEAERAHETHVELRGVLREREQVGDREQRYERVLVHHHMHRLLKQCVHHVTH